ncbi:MAG: hypothetical protein H7839_20600 [Magnetococcus sp. YQC-5]
MTGVPEVDLWASVIQQAIADLSNHRHSRDAESWLLSESLETGSFLFICDSLGLDPDRILAMAWRERKQVA